MTLSKDYVLPFYIDNARVRGRLVRLGDQAQNILDKHQYPNIINQYLIEMMSVAAVLATDVKYSGVFTLQIIGKEAPVRLMVVDITSDGDFRACAKFNDEHLKTLLAKHPSPKPSELFGAGYMLFSAELENVDERYQAVVDLHGSSLSECVQHYFRQSNQIPTAVITFSSPNETSHYIGASLIIQRLPSHTNPTPEQLEKDEDDWFTNVSLMSTIKREEMLDESLTGERLLHRLFHERELICQPLKPLTFQCYCSRQRLEEILRSFNAEDLSEMIVDGEITADCDFCGEHYHFDPKVLIKQN